MSKALEGMPRFGDDAKERLPKFEIVFADWAPLNDASADSFKFTPPDGAQKVASLQDAIAEQFGGGDDDAGYEDMLGKPAPEFALDLLDSGKMSIEAHRGKQVVVLDFLGHVVPAVRPRPPAYREDVRRVQGQGRRLLRRQPGGARGHHPRLSEEEEPGHQGSARLGTGGEGLRRHRHPADRPDRARRHGSGRPRRLHARDGGRSPRATPDSRRQQAPGRSRRQGQTREGGCEEKRPLRRTTRWPPRRCGRATARGPRRPPTPRAVRYTPSASAARRPSSGAMGRRSAPFLSSPCPPASAPVRPCQPHRRQGPRDRHLPQLGAIR